MIWQEFIEAMALGFGGIELTMTGILVSMILIVFIDILVIIAMKEKALTGLLFVDLALSITFTALGWLPLFVGTITAFVFALIGAVFIRDKIGGR